MTETSQAEAQERNIPDKPEEPEKPLAKEVIEELMLMWRDRIPNIIRHLVENASKQGKPVEALRLFNSLKEASEHTLDAAHKLISFQTPKLESVAVRNETIHQFVIRAPAQVDSVEQWIKQTKAERLNVEQFTLQGQTKAPIASSYTDAETEQQEDDHIEDEALTLGPDQGANNSDKIYTEPTPNIKLTKTNAIN